MAVNSREVLFTGITIYSLPVSPLQPWHPSQTEVLSNYNFSDIISVFPEELTVVLNTDVLQVMFYYEMFSKLPEGHTAKKPRGKNSQDWLKGPDQPLLHYLYAQNLLDLCTPSNISNLQKIRT